MYLIHHQPPEYEDKLFTPQYEYKLGKSPEHEKTLYAHAGKSIKCLRQNQLSIGQPIHQSQRAIYEYKQGTKKPIVPSGNLPMSPKG